MLVEVRAISHPMPMGGDWRGIGSVLLNAFSNLALRRIPSWKIYNTQKKIQKFALVN
jgi:hypothetical protein